MNPALGESNRIFLERHSPRSLECLASAPQIPAAAESFTIPLPGGESIRLRVELDAFVRRHQSRPDRDRSGLWTWGASSAEDLRACGERAGDAPWMHLETDPDIFRRILARADLRELFDRPRRQILFQTDVALALVHVADFFGRDERTVNRVDFRMEPALFARLLTKSHPAGAYLCTTLENPFYNQSVEELSAGREFLAGRRRLEEIFTSEYLYARWARIMDLFLVCSPGVRAAYFERVPRAWSDILPISIVILSWNRWDLTNRCLESVFARGLPPDTQIILVDNGSTDGSADRIRSLAESNPQITPVLLDRNLGPAGGRDAATSHIRGLTVVYLDNDVQAMDSRWLSILLEPFLLHSTIGASGAFGVVHDDDESDRWTQKMLFPGLVTPVTWLSGFCVAVRREALVAAGGWRSDLFDRYGMEDVALAWSLRAAGWMAVVPGNYVPVGHGMNHRDGHYDYDFSETNRRNHNVFTRAWGHRRRLLNAARGNETAAAGSKESREQIKGRG